MSFSPLMPTHTSVRINNILYEAFDLKILGFTVESTVTSNDGHLDDYHAGIFAIFASLATVVAHKFLKRLSFKADLYIKVDDFHITYTQKKNH